MYQAAPTTPRASGDASAAAAHIGHASAAAKPA